MLWRSGEGDDGEDSARHARAPGAGNGTADNERSAVGGQRADETAELEDEQREEEGALEREVLEGLTPGTLRSGKRQEACGAVPRELIDRVELVRDSGDRGRDDGHVEVVGESCQEEADHDDAQSGGLGKVGWKKRMAFLPHG